MIGVMTNDEFKRILSQFLDKSPECQLCKQPTAYVHVMTDFDDHVKWITGIPEDQQRMVFFTLCDDHHKDIDNSRNIIEKAFMSQCLLGTAVIKNVGEDL